MLTTDMLSVDWFTADLPKDVCLDGEMWAGRGAYEFVTSLVRRKDTDQEWKQAVFKGKFFSFNN